jgi:hypothetical protein
MKDHEIRELVNLITDIARDFRDTQQLRERIAHTLVPVLKKESAELSDEEIDAVVFDFIEDWGTRRDRESDRALARSIIAALRAKEEG